MSTTAAQKLAKAKVRRQKQIIAVGSVVLLAVLGFQLPKLLGGGGSETALPATTAVPGLLPSPAGAVPVKLPDTDRAVAQRDSNQLMSFGLFKSKDPFVQQLSANASAPTPTPVPAPEAKPASPQAPPAGGPATVPAPNEPSYPGTPETPAPTTPAGGGATTPTGSTPAAPATPATPAAPPTSALIATNGVCQQISVDGTFPNGEDIFRLVSIAKDGKSVKVGVVGGSYDSGQSTADLKLGDKLTLVNTADGTRYVIVLKSKCDVIQQPTAPATTTTTPTVAAQAPPPPATTTTAATSTTPIVPDALDTTATTTTMTP